MVTKEKLAVWKRLLPDWEIEAYLTSLHEEVGS